MQNHRIFGLTVKGLFMDEKLTQKQEQIQKHLETLTVLTSQVGTIQDESKKEEMLYEIIEHYKQIIEIDDKIGKMYMGVAFGLHQLSELSINKKMELMFLGEMTHYYEKALELDESLPIYYNLANTIHKFALAKNDKDTPALLNKAIKIYKKFIDKNPENKPAEFFIGVYHQIAIAYIVLANGEKNPKTKIPLLIKVAKTYKTIIKFNNKDLTAFTNSGVVFYELLSIVKEEIDVYELILTLLEFLETVTELDEKTVTHYNNLCSFTISILSHLESDESKLEKINKVISYLTFMIERFEKFPHPYFNMAIILNELSVFQDTEEKIITLINTSISNYKKAVEFGFDKEPVKNNLKMLSQHLKSFKNFKKENKNAIDMIIKTIDEFING